MMIGLDNPNVLQEDALNLEYLLKLQHQDHLISFQMNLFKVNKISLWPWQSPGEIKVEYPVTSNLIHVYFNIKI